MLRAIFLLFAAAALLFAQTFPANVQVIPSKEAKMMVVKTARPEYPREARTLRIQGDVFLIVLVDEKGKVKQMKFKSGPFQLIQSSMDAVRAMGVSPVDRG